MDPHHHHLHHQQQQIQNENTDFNTLLQLLQKYNLKTTEESFKKEFNKINASSNHRDENTKNDLSSIYFELYELLCKFVDNSPKENKHELAQIKYPVFLHLYLELINKDLTKSAHDFYDKFSQLQLSYLSIDLQQLKLISNKEQLVRSEYKDTIGTAKYRIRISDESFRLLKDFGRSCKNLTEVMKEKILFEIYSGETRDIISQTISIGGILGESSLQDNKKEKMYHGLLRDPDLAIIEDTEDLIDEDNDKPKKKKSKREALTNKKKGHDPNAPSMDRVPLPELREIDRYNKQQAQRDYHKRARLGPDKLPSICFYTILNSFNIVNCCDISDDSTCVAFGLNDSTIRVYTLVPNKKLKLMKQYQDLELLEKESDDVFSSMLDDSTGSDFKSLIGHSGPVFGVSFSPDKYYLISGGEDGTIRLWCLLTFSCLVCYKGHNGPIWDVKFGPYHHYFASCGADKSARLWAIDQYQSLRIYVDHLSDVDCICFHPNSNYLATGCSDRVIRIIDIASKQDNPIIRQLTGHKNSINIVKFSYCGRYLASGGQDGYVYLWDVATPVIVAQFNTHKDSIYSLDFSRDNTVLVSSGLDNTIKIWHISKLTKDIEQLENPTGYSSKTDSLTYEIGSFKTKKTPIINLHFTRRNLLVGVGPYTND